MVDGWKAVGHRYVSESGIRFGHQFYAKISYTISLLCGITGEHGSHKHKHLISRPKYSARFWKKLKYKVLSQYNLYLGRKIINSTFLFLRYCAMSSNALITSTNSMSATRSDDDVVALPCMNLLVYQQICAASILIAVIDVDREIEDPGSLAYFCRYTVNLTRYFNSHESNS